MPLWHSSGPIGLVTTQNVFWLRASSSCQLSNMWHLVTHYLPLCSPFTKYTYVKAKYSNPRGKVGVHHTYHWVGPIFHLASLSFECSARKKCILSFCAVIMVKGYSFLSVISMCVAHSLKVQIWFCVNYCKIVPVTVSKVWYYWLNHSRTTILGTIKVTFNCWLLVPYSLFLTLWANVENGWGP